MLSLEFETFHIASEGLREMFEDMCAGKFLLVLMGAVQRVSHAQTRERGPPSALAKILLLLKFLKFTKLSI